MKTLVLTGGSSGIGKVTVELFAARGWRVFELSRHGVTHDGIIHIDCDVVSEESVQQAMANIAAQTDRIDVLISNAGYGISGAIEFTPIAEAKKQFDVNFFGAMTVVQAVLPYLRKQHSGKIIFTSSVAAVLSVPYQSYYSASKSALNSMALALQNEVREFGISVSVLMPGDVSTDFTQNRNKSEEGLQIYRKMHNAVATMETDEINGARPDEIAEYMWIIANKKHPAPQYVAGGLYKIFCLLNRALPKRLVNWIEGQMY